MVDSIRLRAERRGPAESHEAARTSRIPTRACRDAIEHHPWDQSIEVHPPGCTRRTLPVRSVRMPKQRVKTASELLGVPDAPRTGRDRLVAAAVELLCRREFGAIG